MDGALSQLAGVIFVFALLGGGLWYARKRGIAQWTLRGPSSANQKVSILQRTALTPQHSVHVVAVGERQFVLTCSPSSCQLLAELTAESDRVGVSQGKTTR